MYTVAVSYTHLDVYKRQVYAAYMGFFISIHVSAAKPAFSIVSG